MNRLSTRPPTHWRRPLLALAGPSTAGLALLPGATASAHVRATPDNPTSRGFSALAFRVPDASATPAPGETTATGQAVSTSAADPVAPNPGGLGLVAGLGALVFAFLAGRRGSGPEAG